MAASEATLRKLIAETQAKMDGLQEALNRLEAAVVGTAVTQQDVRTAMATWATLWSKRYAPGNPKAYRWQAKAEVVHLPGLIRDLGLQELETRMKRYLANRDPFFTSSSHTFSKFVATINQHAQPVLAEMADDIDETPEGCRHQPRCRNDAAHTKRTMAEMAEMR